MSDDTFVFKSSNGKGVLFQYPYVISKNKLSFNDNTCSCNCYYDYTDKSFILGTNIHLNLSDDDKKFLDNLYITLYNKANEFYKQVLKQDVNLLVSEDKKNIYTLELLDNSFGKYYLKIFTYATNKVFKTNFKEFKEVESNLLGRIVPDKLKQVKNDYGKFFAINIKDLKH